MKKLFAIIIGFLFTFSLNAQITEERYQELKAITDSSSVNTVYKEILEKTDLLNAIRSHLNNLENIISPPRYKIFKTQDKSIFLELDTQFGRLYKIQWPADKKKTSKLKRPIGDVTDLNEPWENHYPGRYDLYETTDTNNYILIDSYTGGTWKIQLGKDKDEDVIEQIRY